jgi:hypothetical protein
MPFAKGKSGNPGGRPKATRLTVSIRARARVDSQRAYETLLLALSDEKQRVTAAVNILRLAGVSFQSDNEEAKTVAEAARAMVAGSPVEQLEEIAGVPSLPLN